jgi:hypothetical protein
MFSTRQEARDFWELNREKLSDHSKERDESNQQNRLAAESVLREESLVTASA